MKAARWWVMVVALSLLGGRCLAAEQLSAEKKADIEHLLEMTGAASMGKQMAVLTVAQLTQMLRRTHPEIPQKALDVLPAEIGAVFDEHMDSFKATVIPIYDKYFTGEEIKEMIRFYSTDLGKKTIKVMPSLLGESMQAGRKWGESLGPEIARRVRARLKQEGIEI